MKQRGLWAAGVVLLVVGVVAVLAIEAGYAKNENAAVAKCSEATLHGTYLFAVDGFDITGNEQVPFAVAGLEVYNGNGKVRGVSSGNLGGEVFRKEPYSATYTVEADCTGTFTSDGTQVDLFIAPDGSMFTFVDVDPGTVASGFELRGTAKRVAKNENAGAKCSEATLHGQYLFATEGVDITGNEQVPFAAAGYDVYNGNGKVKGVSSVNFNGEVLRNERFSGAYTVKADCTGTLTFADGGQLDLFVAPDGSMYTIVETDPGLVASGFELRGTAKRVAP
jgi:hypothetical protein